jgi:hypothetical protein
VSAWVEALADLEARLYGADEALRSDDLEGALGFLGDLPDLTQAGLEGIGPEDTGAAVRALSHLNRTQAAIVDGLRFAASQLTLVAANRDDASVPRYVDQEM